MKIYNTYTSSYEEFIPLKKGQVSMYVCGPTVYNYIHIGNARPVIFFDTVRRYFEYLGYHVDFASNFTDVDDKIIQKAIDEHKTEKEVSEYYINAFLEDVARLGSKTDYLKPKVTEYMNQIIAYIEALVDKGFAYQKDGDVYFRVSKVEEYGHLSNRKLDDLISGARVEVNELKESPVDFTLWKKTETGIAWDASFSKGRPGWHTECCTMIDDIFHGKIDIHGGGSDLIFPHHENEIAQSIAQHDHSLAQIWMHNGRLNLDGEKMSKSLGNLIWVKDLPVNPKSFRLFVLATHYRSPLNYSSDNLEAYDKEYLKMVSTVSQLHRKLDLQNIEMVSEVQDETLLGFLNRFMEAMDYDFNTPNAITELQGLIKWINVALRSKVDWSVFSSAGYLADLFMDILGIKESYTPLSSEDKELFRKWDEARANKDFEAADVYRQALQNKGLV
ncbi:MAG: cysteine--tRNA ligase [Candidatus Izemoplasmatales bacterium]